MDGNFGMDVPFQHKVEVPPNRVGRPDERRATHDHRSGLQGRRLHLRDGERLPLLLFCVAQNTGNVDDDVRALGLNVIDDATKHVHIVRRDPVVIPHVEVNCGRSCLVGLDGCLRDFGWCHRQIRALLPRNREACRRDLDV